MDLLTITLEIITIGRLAPPMRMEIKLPLFVNLSLSLMCITSLSLQSDTLYSSVRKWPRFLSKPYSSHNLWIVAGKIELPTDLQLHRLSTGEVSHVSLLINKNAKHK